MTTPSPTFSTVLLDYGHGGFDPVTGEYLTVRDGEPSKCYTFTSEDPPLFIGEGHTNRETAWRLARLLLSYGVRVYDVVKGDYLLDCPTLADLEPRNISLVERVENANRFDAKRSVYVSMHSNAIGEDHSGPGHSVRGTSIWTSRGQTLSDAVADTMAAGFREAFEGTSMRLMRGQTESDGDIDYEAGFYVLRKTYMPAVLGEVGFFTNITDARYLLSESGQGVIARGYFLGLRPWLKPGEYTS